MNDHKEHDNALHLPTCSLQLCLEVVYHRRTKDVLAPIGSRAFLHYLGTLPYYRCGTYEKTNMEERFWHRGFSDEAEYAIRILTERKRDKSTR